ncbi:transcription elongation factor A N-terminal and central domain-containing protein 2-like [Uloborus diversus]|uniref:transcription elongation factor A N-terminal and central domain-containing protein 2-like n=1 Tax=Uloborus diversus TaxID=327109 RepID=UPI00240A18D4|nr:transcription elongation factor A N-terminal and central domain-containing protein 2-like [Uloborus diversus]
MPKLKQATLSSLKGVVIMEDFIRHKNLLNNEDESDDAKLESLTYLKGKKPSKEIISSTGIGAVLRSFENHGNKKIADEAKDLCKFWELHTSQKCQPTVEVRYDNLTRHIRRTSTRLFAAELGDGEEDEKTADALEKEIFHKCNRFISKSYRKTVRKITFVLRHDGAEKEAFKNGKISPSQFVLKYIR